MSDEATMSDTATAATAKVIDINSAKAPKERKSTRKRRKQPKEEQVFVECAAGHDDLCNLPGVLTLDYDGKGKVFDATFDPADEAIPNAVIPVKKFVRSDAAITLTSDCGESWAFAIDTDTEA